MSPVIVLKDDSSVMPEFLDLMIMRLMKHVDFAAFKLMKRHAVVIMQPIRYGRVMIGSGYLANMDAMRNALLQ